MKHAVRVLVVAVAWGVNFAAAMAADSAARDAELSAIRQASQEFVAAFNKGDAKRVAAHWTPDGELIDDEGNKYSGRDAIAKEYAELFKTQPNLKMRLIVDSLKLLSDGAAIEEGRAMLEPPPAGAPAISKYLVVHVKVDGKWLMSTVRDTRVELPSAYRQVSELEWLVGTWRGEEHGAKSESVCRWIANKSFIERRYTVTSHDGTAVSGVQIIGWNPLGGHVQSWNFSADGGHAVGVWSAREDGWLATVSGVTGDGRFTTSKNVIRRLDDGAYAWQSVERTVDEQRIADSDEIVMKRVGN